MYCILEQVSVGNFLIVVVVVVFLPDYRALIKFNFVKNTNKQTEVHTCLKFCQKFTDIKGICDINSNLPSSTT